MSKTVLITNIALCYRTGTEVVVEQLADGLRRRGHRPILFASLLGPLAEAMRGKHEELASWMKTKGAVVGVQPDDEVLKK